MIGQKGMQIDSRLSWAVSCLSGLVFGSKTWVTVVRITVYVLLIGIWFLPAVYSFSFLNSIIFSISISLILFLTKLVLYALNKIIDCTEEQPPDGTQNAEIVRCPSKMTLSDVPPDGIPADLWAKRKEIDTQQPITEKVFSTFIEQGYDPNVVVKFIQTIIPAQNSNSGNLLEPEPRKYKRILKVLGKEFPIKFNRLSVNRLFPENYSLLYCFLVLITSLTMCCAGSLMLSFMPLSECLWIPFIFGPALYSTLHPPEVDPYSTTRGDIFTGITRPFIIFCISTVILFLYENPVPPQFIYDLKFPFDAEIIYSGVTIFLKISLILFPIWTFFFLGHPITTLNWGIEFVSRYVFGHAGATSILNSFLQFLRSLLICAGVYLILQWHVNGITISLCIAFTVMLIQYPMSPKALFKRKTLRTLLVFLGMGVCAFLASYAGYTFSYLSSDIVYIFCICAIFLIEIVWPFISSISSYLICYIRLCSFFSRTLRVLKLITPALFCPVMLSVLFARNKEHPLILSHLIVMSIHRSLTEPYILCFSMIVTYFTFLLEGNCTNWTLSYFWASIIVRKLISIITSLEFYLKARTSTIISFFQKMELDENSALIRNSLVSTLLILIPSVDRIVGVPALVWSLFTGAPYNMYRSSPFILCPLPPRPNSFWNQILVHQNVDIAKSYQVHRTDHPIETPVYTSLAKTLTSSLSSLVKSGLLGLVTSNDVFLFLSEPLAAFVHVIALEPNCVRFQLRGLEYNDETVCHLGEIARLQEDINSYKDRVPNFKAALLYKSTNWKTRATGIKLLQYNISKTKVDNAFIGVDAEETLKWAALTVCAVCRSANIDGVESCEVKEEMRDPITIFKLEHIGGSLQRVYDALVGKIFSEGRLNYLRLFDAFHDPKNPPIQRVVRQFLLVLSLASMGLAPDLDEELDSEEIPKFFSSVFNEYFAAPVASPEFDAEFNNEERSLVSVEDTAEGPCVLFFRLDTVRWDVVAVQKDFVRSFWGSEIISQIFFGEDNSERNSIQEDDHMLRNLIVQACDLPIGYPALVSPVIGSYSPPPNFEKF